MIESSKANEIAKEAVEEFNSIKKKEFKLEYISKLKDLDRASRVLANIQREIDDLKLKFEFEFNSNEK